jgi:hypothetical protein
MVGCKNGNHVVLKDSCHAVMNQAIIEGIKQRKMCEEREIADLLLWTIKPRSELLVLLMWVQAWWKQRHFPRGQSTAF